jgi:hypothetical protein
MAAIDDVNTAVASLKDAITVALNDLASKADAGSLSGADVRTVIGTLNTEHDAVLAAVSAVDNQAVPAGPPGAVPIDPSTTPASAGIDPASVDPSSSSSDTSTQSPSAT